jgi:CRP/FNR family cyclic AMP-dependent transcriptional regulator
LEPFIRKPDTFRLSNSSKFFNLLTTTMNAFSTPELPAIGILASLEDEDRKLLGNYGEFLPLQAEDTLINEGEPQDAIYFVISGLLHVHTLEDGKRTLLGRVGAGETLGEVNIFDPEKASANVTAKEFCQIWKARREDIEAFLKSYPSAAGKLLIAMMASVSKRIRKANARLSATELKAAIEHMWR